MSVAATAIGRASAPAPPPVASARGMPVAGLLAFVALALLAAMRFASLLAHPPTWRVLGIVLVVGSAGAALALTAALPRTRGLAVACRIALLLAGGYLSLRLAGVPPKLLFPWQWPALARRLAHGLQELNGLWPYTGESSRARLVVVVALGAALMAAAALVFWPAAGAARRRRVAALAILLGVYLTAVINQQRAGWQLQGLMLLGLLSLWGWAWWPRMHERGRALAWLSVGAVLALILSGPVARSGALIDFHDWNPFGRVYPAQSFDWNQTYGPRVWPNTREAMVEVSADAPRLWRASTLDRFDGVRFLRSPAPPARTSGLPAGRLPARWLQRATFTVRGLSSVQLLSPGVTLALSSSSSQLRRRARLASDGTVALSGEAPPSGARYTVSAYVPQPSPAALRAAPQRTPAAYAPYTELELPGASGVARPVAAQSVAGAARIASSPYAGVLALAHRLAAGVGSNYEVARRIEAYLRSGGYIYDERPPNRRYPLASFLLEDRRGYCQQFSGAMALLLRMDGIPARVAAGFLAGSRERASGRFLVTAQDAHAWVEVYFAGIGWVAFDPTPAVAGGGRGAALEHLVLHAPAAGAAARAGATHRARRRTGGAAKPSRAAAHSASATALALALVAALGLTLLALWPLTRALRRRERATEATGSVAELARALVSLGIPLRDETTLAELETRLARSHGSQAAGYVRLLRERRYAAVPDPRRPDDRDRRLLRRALCAGRGPLARLRALRALPPGCPHSRVHERVKSRGTHNPAAALAGPAARPLPGGCHAWPPQRAYPGGSYPLRMPSLLDRALNVGEAKKFKTYQKRVSLIGAFEGELEHDSDEELRERMDVLRGRAVDGESLDALLPECFAIVRETGKRRLEMRHFDVQLIGAMALHDGQISEMKTGEGKTLTATLAVVLNALAVHPPDPEDAEAEPRRKGVHLVTVNDYLAQRDAEWMSPIYEALGVSVGVLQNMQAYEEKQRAYACDVVYGTNSEFGFDYLRDNMAKDLSEKVQRGHAFAIVDEVDNILIDEARTPLIISGAPEQAADLYVKFARLAPQMVSGKTPEGMDPRTKKQFVADFDYEVDEKQKTVAITEQGVAKAERFLNIDHLYRAENGHLVNHLIQALRAESLYKRDVDYAVIDGEVKIIDEFTGRILDGRRWSEGLHQAVEAKERVPIQEENQTLATITYQNFFRLYDKLAGMTGTALTEATEFMKIYELPVVQIPTNREMVRADRNDQVYKTKQGKWAAVAKEIEARHANGQPVLVGTISVEVSELLSAQLTKRGIKHTVLNAKPEHAAREADIVAEAGQPGAVTIATNMAGRGVDIKLGGNPEHLAHQQLARDGIDREDAEEYERRMQAVLPEVERKLEDSRQQVMAAGGLFICGTERHESRRIDNQLRGRAGRQGDPGESRFFLSAEDDLVRLFAGDRIYKILDKLGGVDEEGNEEPIEAGMLSKQIEKAQKKVEEQNFLIRKRVLEYDDVMNEQRRVIYAYRDEVLEGKSIGEEARQEVVKVIERTIDQYTPGDFMEDWDLDGMFTALGQFFPIDLGREDLDGEAADRNALSDRIVEQGMELYAAREASLGEELMGALERFLLLQIIDERWREHLFDMDYLREGIHLRGFAQIDPLVAYKNEAFTLFGDLMNSVWTDYTRMIFNVQVNVEGQNGGGGEQPSFAAAGSSTRAGRVSYSGGHSAAGAGALAAAAAAAGQGYEDGEELEAMPVVEQRVLDDEHQVGRNDPCWCGSGKKFKKCHGS